MQIDFSNIELGKKYTREHLAELWGMNGTEGLKRGVYTPSGEKEIILFVTRIKSKSMTQYNDYIDDDVLYWDGEKKHGNDRRISTAHTNGETIHLFYREMYRMPFIYRGTIRILSFTQKEKDPSKFKFYLDHDLGINDDLNLHQGELANASRTEREALTKARLGQGKFREDLLKIWGSCAVTGIQTRELLTASHIKPWRLCNNKERIDPNNGLPLLPQYDRLFDKGFISFDSKGKILISRAIEFIPLKLIGISIEAKLRRSVSEEYLSFHRKEVFVD